MTLAGFGLTRRRVAAFAGLASLLGLGPVSGRMTAARPLEDALPHAPAVQAFPPLAAAGSRPRRIRSEAGAPSIGAVPLAGSAIVAPAPSNADRGTSVATAIPHAAPPSGMPPAAVVERSRPDTEKLFRAAARDSAPQPVLIELRIRGLASATVQAYRVRSEALLPLAQFLSLAEARYRLSPDGVLEASIPPGPRRLLVAAGRDTMAFGDHRVRLEPEYRLFKDGELYVGAERLGDLLGTTIAVDWSALTVTVLDADMLPIGQRARRDAARAELARRRDRGPADVRLGLDRQVWDGGGLVLDYQLFAPGGRPVGDGSYAFELGSDAFGGSLAVGAQSVGPANAGVTRGDVSWTGVWEEHRWLKQLRVGDGLSTGPRTRELRGLALTNAPFLRPALLGTSRYLGRLEPGWSVEAYQDGQLIAVDTTDAAGAYGFALPVRYGENPVDFVAYGPLGDVRQFDRTYRVLSELLPARRFEYGVSGGACRDSRCRASGNLDVRYGLSSRVTLQGGADRFWRDGLADLWHPYAAITANPTNDWALELSGVGNALVRGAVVFEPSLDLRVSAAAAAFDTRPAAPIVTVAGRRSAWNMSAFLRPLPRSGLFYLEGNLDQTRGVTGTTTQARIGASVQTGATRLMPYTRVERQAVDGASAATRAFVGVSAFVLPLRHLGPVLGAAFFRGALESQVSAGAPRLTQVSLYASRPLWGGVSLETGVVWQRGNRAPQIQVTLNTYLSAVRSFTTMSAAAGQPATVSQLVQGSVLWDREGGRLAAAPGPSIERAGVAGRVFLDENQNGRYDPGEPPVPGVRVIVGSRPAVSDSSGAFRVWDLMPFEPVDVLVDSLSLDSPLLVPAFARATLVPNPNRFRTLDVPIDAAGVIEGHVWREIGGTREPMGVVALVLTERRTGTSRRFASFSDGTFYLMGVKAGEYELVIDDGATGGGAELGAAPLRFTLTPEAAAAGRSGLELVLRPTR